MGQNKYDESEVAANNDRGEGKHATHGAGPNRSLNTIDATIQERLEVIKTTGMHARRLILRMLRKKGS